MSTEEFWRGEFGNEYTKRNRVDWRARIPFWKRIVDKTGARSVFEFGCNAGWNLSAIRTGCEWLVNAWGVEINKEAAIQATQAQFYVGDRIIDNPKPMAELVFTAGVLIHIAPEDIKNTMQKLVDSSYDYVLAVEYEAEEETEVEYRGHSGKLWKRPYGKLYQDMGLELVEMGNAEGFDQCTYWLLRKP